MVTEFRNIKTVSEFKGFDRRVSQLMIMGRTTVIFVVYELLNVKESNL